MIKDIHEQMLKHQIGPWSRERMCLVEGCHSFQPRLREYYDLSICMICSEDSRRERMEKREPGSYERYHSGAEAKELDYVQSCGLLECCDVLIDTDA